MKKLLISILILSFIGCQKEQSKPQDSKPVWVKLGSVTLNGDSTFYNIQVIK